MDMPDKDHPVWKLAQSCVALVGLAIMVAHGIEGEHAGWIPDLSDAAGIGATGIFGKLVYQLWRS